MNKHAIAVSLTGDRQSRHAVRLLLLLLLAESFSPCTEAAITSFPLQQPFGQLKVSEADCCPYAGLPVLPKRFKKPRIAIVIGVQKAATTLLYQLLTLHPGIARGESIDRYGPGQQSCALLEVFATKERHFFDRLPNNTYNQELVNYAREFRDRNGSLDKVWLDATPDYIDVPSAACRIKTAFPQARLVVLLRDPVMRAFSQWRMVNEVGLWKLLHYTPRGKPLYPFAQEVQHEAARLAAMGCLFNATLPPSNSSAAGAAPPASSAPPRSWNDCFHCHFMHCGLHRKHWHTPDDVCDFADFVGILTKGMYAPQIAWWLNFFPPSQLLILNSADLSRDQGAVMARVFEFLSLPAMELPPAATRARTAEVEGHMRHSSEYAEEHSAASLQELYRFFAPLNSELYELLDVLGVHNFSRFPTEYSP